VAGNDQIPAGPRGEIAWNGRFHVETLLHLEPIPPLIQLVTLRSRQTRIKPVPVGPAEPGEPTGGQPRTIRQQGGPGQRFDYDEFCNTQQLSSQ
jgi:hypothetical protein